MRKVKVVFELVRMLDEGHWYASCAPYYMGSVNGDSTGKSKVFSAKEVPGNVLGDAAFTKVVEVEDADSSIEVKFRAWNNSASSDDYLGGVTKVLTPPWYKTAHATDADSGKYVLHWRVEPLGVGDAPPPPAPFCVCREHRDSANCSTLASSLVEIGLCVRGCWKETHEPSITVQHADMTLPTDAGNHRTLIGFFGDVSVVLKKRALGKLQAGLNDVKGQVYRDAVMNANRPAYYSARDAAIYGVITLFCRLEVLSTQAKAIADKWQEFESNPPVFNGFGHNCSTRAAETLAAGSVLTHIEHLDTPYNLFRTLKKIYGDKLKCEAGFAGFDAGVYGIRGPVPPAAHPPQTRTVLDSLQ